MLFLMKPSSLFPLILSFSIVIRHINVSTVFPFFPLPVLSPPTSCTALGSPYPSFSLINHGVGQVSPVSTAFSPCLPTSHVSLSLALPFPTLPSFTTSPSLVSPSLSSNSHPMQIHSMSSIFKPKLSYLTTFLASSFSPKCSFVIEALSHSLGKQAMQSEFDALTRNQTWSLLSYSP